MARLGHEIAALIQQQHPRALKGDYDELAKVTADIAITLGGLIAFSIRLNSQDQAAAVIRKIFNTMLDQAGLIDNKALEILLRERQSRAN